MFPAAPVLFSTRNGWPNLWRSSSASRRATMSVAPPGANGTTIVTGLFGQSSAARAMAGSMSDAAASVVKRRRVIIGSSSKIAGVFVDHVERLTVLAEMMRVERCTEGRVRFDQRKEVERASVLVRENACLHRLRLRFESLTHARDDGALCAARQARETKQQRARRAAGQRSAGIDLTPRRPIDADAA